MTREYEKLDHAELPGAAAIRSDRQAFDRNTVTYTAPPAPSGPPPDVGSSAIPPTRRPWSPGQFRPDATEAEIAAFYARIAPPPKPADLVSSTGGLRKNGGKVRVDLVPPSLPLAVAGVLGAATESGKYPARNWELGLPYMGVLASLERHTLAFKGGEDIDPDTGRPHADMIACNAAFLIEYRRRIANGTLPASLDDRPRYAPVSE